MKSKKKGILIKVLFICLIITVSATAYLTSGILSKEIYKGVYIDGKSVGGMDKDEAVEHLLRNNRRSTESFQLTLKYGKHKWVFDHNDIGGSLKVDEAVDKAYSVGREGNIFSSIAVSRKIKKEPVTIYSLYEYDRDKLLSRLELISKTIDKEAVNAVIEFYPDEEDKFIIKPEEDGIALDINRIIKDLDKELAKGNIKPTITMQTVPIEPKVTTKDLEELTNCISTFSTDLSASSGNRTHNIILAAKAFNGMVVEPGKTVSFNYTTGERTLENGYKKAPAIMADKSYEEVPGGGVCQVSSTLYNAVLRAGLEIVELTRHSLPVSYLDKGLDATVNLPDPPIDFKFKNNRDTAVFLRTYVKDQRIYFEVYGKELPDGQHIEIRTEEYERIPAPEPEYIEDVEGKHVKYKDETHEKVKSREGYKVRVYKDIYEGENLVDSLLIDDHFYQPVKGIVYVGTEERPEPGDEDIIIKNIKKIE